MSRIRQGHQVQLLQGGVEYFDALVQAITVSQAEVRLETYILHPDASTERVVTALETAAARGVRVYLTVDGAGTPNLPTEWTRRFASSGVQWHVFSRLGRLGILIPSRWRRLHRKLCVIDGQVGFCGGINLLDDFFDPNHGALSRPRLDFAVRIEGPLVRDMYETMARVWWRQTLAADVRARDFKSAWRDLQASVRRTLGLVRPHSARDSALSAQGTASQVYLAQAELLLRDNLGNRRRIERAYIAAITTSAREIVIANAYFLPGRALRVALVQAARRGVRVRLLLQGRYEYFMQYHGSRPVYAALLKAGIEIHEYAASFLHAKVAVIDSRWATVGSSNLDPLSLLLAREANVVIVDDDFASTLQGRLEEAMRLGGEPLDAAAFAARPWQQRLKESVAYGLMRFALLLTGRRY